MRLLSHNPRFLDRPPPFRLYSDIPRLKRANTNKTNKNHKRVYAISLKNIRMIRFYSSYTCLGRGCQGSG